MNDTYNIASTNLDFLLDLEYAKQKNVDLDILNDDYIADRHIKIDSKLMREVLRVSKIFDKEHTANEKCVKICQSDGFIVCYLQSDTSFIFKKAKLTNISNLITDTFLININSLEEIIKTQIDAFTIYQDMKNNFYYRVDKTFINANVAVCKPFTLDMSINNESYKEYNNKELRNKLKLKIKENAKKRIISIDDINVSYANAKIINALLKGSDGDTIYANVQNNIFKSNDFYCMLTNK